MFFFTCLNAPRTVVKWLCPDASCFCQGWGYERTTSSHYCPEEAQTTLCEMPELKELSKDIKVFTFLERLDRKRVPEWKKNVTVLNSLLLENMLTGSPLHGQPLNCHAGPCTNTATTLSLFNKTTTLLQNESRSEVPCYFLSSKEQRKQKEPVQLKTTTYQSSSESLRGLSMTLYGTVEPAAFCLCRSTSLSRLCPCAFFWSVLTNLKKTRCTCCRNTKEYREYSSTFCEQSTKLQLKTYQVQCTSDLVKYP